MGTQYDIIYDIIAYQKVTFQYIYSKILSKFTTQFYSVPLPYRLNSSRLETYLVFKCTVCDEDYKKTKRFATTHFTVPVI